MDRNVFKDVKEGCKDIQNVSKESRQWNEIRKSIQYLETEFNKVINILGGGSPIEILEIKNSAMHHQ